MMEDKAKTLGQRWSVLLLTAAVLLFGVGIANAENAWASDDDKSGGLIFEWLSDVPKTETVYTAGAGKISWTPKLQDGQVVSGTILLRNAEIDNSGGMGIQIPVPVEIKVEGENQITASSIGICASNKQSGAPVDLNFTGAGSLKLNSQKAGIQASGNVIVDGLRLEVLYGATAETANGIQSVLGDITIKDCQFAKIRNHQGVSGGSAICSGQAGGKTVRIADSHVIAINEGGKAIHANTGKLELISSHVRAIGNTSTEKASGTLDFNESMMAGGTLFAQNKGADLEMPSVSTKPLKASNNAVLYGFQSGSIPPLEGDIVWYFGCSYDEAADEVTLSNTGFIFGDVTWNEHMSLAGKSLTIGTYSKKASSLTIPKGTTVDMTDGSTLNVRYKTKPQKSSSLIIDGTLNVQNGCRINNDNNFTLINNGTLNVEGKAEAWNYQNAAFVNNGTMNIQDEGAVYNAYDATNKTGGIFQNNGLLNVSSAGIFQNQNRLENSGTIHTTGNFSTILITGYNAAVENSGTINGFVIEMRDDSFVNVANGETVLKQGQTLTLGAGVASSGKRSRILKIPEGSKLTVEEGAVVDAKTYVTLDTVADYIDLGSTMVVNGQLLLPENTPDTIMDKIAANVVGTGQIKVGDTVKHIIVVDTGEKSESQFIEQGGTVSLPESPIRDGYYFAGWYAKEGDLLEPFEPGTQIQKSMEILAKWVGINQWTTPISIKGWSYGEPANTPSAASKFGTVFYQYSNSANGAFTETVPEKAGTWYARAIVKATEEYTGLESTAVPFRIEPKAYQEGGSIQISEIKSAEDVKNMVITDGSKTLIENEDYRITTNTNGNHVTVTITFCGNYAGSVNKSYQTMEPTQSATRTDEPKESAASKADIAKNNVSINRKAKLSISGTKLKVSWSKVNGAAGYDIYAGSCGGKAKLVKSIKGNAKTSLLISKINKKKISTKGTYKAQIKAYRIVKGKKETIGRTMSMHVVGKHKKGYTNAKAIKVSKAGTTVKKGKTQKIKAKTIKQDSRKKLLPKKHIASYRYYSTNEEIASVSSAGTIKGKNKGKCTVYVVSANGVKKGIKVTVK